METNRQKTQSRAFAALMAGVLAAVVLLVPTPGASAETSPFERAGMWIWYVDDSQGGSVSRIVRRARASRIGTVYIKSADGTGTWSQFTKSLVSQLKAAGLSVCGWQYVYGRSPIGEARAAAVAKQRGADCFVIDAETEYEGNYAGADLYIRKLRQLVGNSFPLGLSTFPYVHYHQAFPYSVFMGPRAATWNLPQIYWHTIGDSVRESVGITWYQNRLYKRPIRPLGQTYENPPLDELTEFRRLMLAYDAIPSWWSWQETNGAEWSRLGLAVRSAPANYEPITSFPTLRKGSAGDQVVWMQQHLVGAGLKSPISGIFGTKTRNAVREFQESRGLTTDGVVGGVTWRELLKVTPVRVLWGAARSASGRSSESSGASAPLSASIPAVRNELAGAPGR
ncbi:MAG: peptidoglycan-binding domain-containing protein [Solirubrobacterales bacterium]